MQDQPQPQRIRHGLDGQCVVAVACGDDCTAAVTDTGSLYMWGRLHMDSRPQLVPLHVRGDLTGQRVVQVRYMTSSAVSCHQGQCWCLMCQMRFTFEIYICVVQPAIAVTACLACILLSYASADR